MRLGLLLILSLLTSGCATSTSTKMSLAVQKDDALEVQWQLPDTSSRLYYKACLEYRGYDSRSVLRCYDKAMGRYYRMGNTSR